MAHQLLHPAASARPAPSAVLELLKPITWFPPMWAFGCGVVSSAAPLSEAWPWIIAGAVLAGPLVCGMSQAVNDWYDRHVDAINEPHRPIPSGRIPGRWGLYIALVWTALSLVAGWLLGPWAFAATIVGTALAWAYSAPPLRLKQDGWWGNAACGACYEGLPWITGAAVAAGGTPDVGVFYAAALYSLGAHGIMTLNDFKSVEGDRRMGVRSLPVQLGVEGAARVACVVMALPQLVVVGLLWRWNVPWYAATVAAFLATQLLCMKPLLAAPKEKAPWYNGTGVMLYVLGMLVTAFALRQLAGA